MPNVVRVGSWRFRTLSHREGEGMRANMPGSMREVKNAEEEGVRFEWLAAPEAFIGEGRVQGLASDPVGAR